MTSNHTNIPNHNGSTFNYFPNYLSNTEQKELLKYMENTCNFIAAPQYTDKVSRYQKWYQSNMKYFCPLWKARYPQWESHEMDSTILSLIDSMQSLVGSTELFPQDININSCLVNKYPDGNHFISPHRDSPDSFGPTPTIIILSLGETRTLMFENEMEKFSFDLESGSVFIMGGNSQKNYLHSLLKSDTKNVRYSLTFREFIL